MIEFASEEIRTLFHSLPIDTQQEYNNLAATFMASGQVITITDVEYWGEKHLEVSIRIDQKFNGVGSRES